MACASAGHGNQNQSSGLFPASADLERASLCVDPGYSFRSFEVEPEAYQVDPAIYVWLTAENIALCVQ